MGFQTKYIPHISQTLAITVKCFMLFKTHTYTHTHTHTHTHTYTNTEILHFHKIYFSILYLFDLYLMNTFFTFNFRAQKSQEVKSSSSNSKSTNIPKATNFRGYLHLCHTEHTDAFVFTKPALMPFQIHT
jgi:hypothetical protein